MEEYWGLFIDGFCEVEFLCFAAEPNWLGWIVVVFGGVVALILAMGIFMAVVNICGYVGISLYYKIPKKWRRDSPF